MQKLEKIIKELQMELMATTELSHVNVVRFLAAADAAERNLIRERKPEPIPEIQEEEKKETEEEVEEENTTIEENIK